MQKGAEDAGRMRKEKIEKIKQSVNQVCQDSFCGSLKRVLEHALARRQ